MKTFFYYLGIFLVLFSVSCKKEKNLTKSLTSYVIGNSTVSLYEKMDVTSKIVLSLKLNSDFQILEKDIPDSVNKKLSWFKVSYSDKVAYVSMREYESNNISIFEAEKSTEPYYVLASSLRLRKSPTLTGEIITNLPKNTQVTILEKSVKSQQIDGKYDYWVKVKTQDGKMGYSYRGYLITGLHPEWKEEVANGYMVIKDTSELLDAPAGEKVESSESDPNLFDVIKVGDIVPALTKATVNGKVYYQVKDRYTETELQSMLRDGNIFFWIEASKVDYFGPSVADYTKEKFGFDNEGLFNALKANIGNKFDTRKVTTKPMGANESGYFFLYVKIDSNTAIYKGYDNLSRIYQEHNGEYSEIFSETTGGWNSIEFYDFNKDGIEEFSIDFNGRMSSRHVFYVIQNNKPKEILSIESGEMNEDNGDYYYLSTDIKEDRVTQYKSKDQEKTKTIFASYVFQNDKFVKQ
ncbi:MAG TPA: SH3 domain-containing protein [Leptospiraceae bacterium]|nr:SH3 domain-containing protein [Leptospiraceae bacterium]